MIFAFIGPGLLGDSQVSPKSRRVREAVSLSHGVEVTKSLDDAGKVERVGLVAAKLEVHFRRHHDAGTIADLAGE
eukprot:scaffold2963_cov250-Pinguiococcus_pyrenoidosus.AAC.33